VSDFKFIHAADVHLDAPLAGLARYPGAPVDEVRGATRRAFERLVDLAIEEQVAFVVVAGDLFDGASRDYHTALFLNAEASRLRAAGMPLLIASGNHDAASILTNQLRPPDNVTLLSTTKPSSVTLENVGVVVHGQGFARREVFDNLAAAYPTPSAGYLNVGVLHTSVDGRPGHVGYAPCTLDELRSKGYDYWALGHVHTREEICTDPWIVFSGCTQGRNIREAGAKGATLVAVEAGVIAAVEHHDLDVLRWARVEVEAAEADEDELLSRVRDAVEAAAMAADERLLATRIIVGGETALHRTLIADRERVVNEIRTAINDVAPGQAWLERVKFETAVPADVARLIARDDAIGGLLRTLRSLPGDQAALSALSDELSDLKRKLPVDLVDDDFDLDDPRRLGRLAGDIEHLLLPRLIGVDS
jgi:DNA repair exonuclease SbcCD nuclease subunit